jgi:hypothetical protein
VLPGWLKAFAEDQGLGAQLRELRSEDFLRVLKIAAVDRVLRRSEPNEPQWAKEFREFALGQHVPSPEALLALEPPAAAGGAAVAVFRRNLYQEANSLVQQVLEKSGRLKS